MGRDIGQPAFERERMIEVLIYHQRASSDACACGWAKLGHSHPEHVVDVYEQSVLVTQEQARDAEMCPHCGSVEPGTDRHGLIVTHDWPVLTRQVCPGSGQNPRNAESDARPLWNGEPNSRFRGTFRD